MRVIRKERNPGGQDRAEWGRGEGRTGQDRAGWGRGEGESG